MARWGAEWLVRIVGNERSIPAFEFLRAQPAPVRQQLLAIVDAVRTVGPDRWMDPNTHRAMKGEIDHLHEARDKHGDTLYRLFLLWQRSESRRVIFIDGRAKPDGTALGRDEYDAIGNLASTLEQEPPPIGTVDDFARTLLSNSG